MKEKLRQGIARFRSNEYLYLILAFLIPVTVMYVIYVFMSVWPFGKYSCMALDLNGQYVYYFEKLRDVLTQGGSLLYSWERSLGGEFMGIFAYYLASPLSWIVCLFPKAMMTEAILCLLLLKMGICGLCFGLYLHHRRPGSRYGVVLFSVLYAMSAYGVIQSMNTMWIDAMYLLPLLAMSLERLADGGRFRMFTVVLALTLLSNFYIGYMMAIFSVLYYLCYYFSRHSLRRLGRFAGCSLKALWGGILAVMLSAVILLPAWYSLGFGKTDFQTTDYSFFQRFDFVLFHVDCTEHKIHLCSNFFHLGSIQNHHLFDCFRHRCFHQPAAADSILIGLACGACRCSQSRKLKPGMIFQQGNKTLAHHASCTNNANFVLFHLKLPSFPPEPQRTFGDSASVPSPIPLPICSCRRRFAGGKHKPAAAFKPFCCQTRDNKKTGLKTGTKCNIMIHCMSTAQHVNPNVTVPPLFGCGPRNDACRASPSADVPFHSPQAFGWHKREYTDEIRASVPHGGCYKIQSPPACLNNSIARPTCQRKKEAKQC